MAIEFDLNPIESVTTDGDVVKRRAVSIPDQIAADRYKNRGKRKPRCIRLVREYKI